MLATVANRENLEKTYCQKLAKLEYMAHNSRKITILVFQVGSIEMICTEKLKTLFHSIVH